MSAGSTSDVGPRLPADVEKVDVLIIGAGQAGLAAGFYLRKTSLSFLIVDRSRRVGDSWRKRYDSLTLFTPRAFSALPGLILHGDPEGYPTRDEFAYYLETYASRFDLPVRPGNGVTRLIRESDHRFRASLGDGTDIVARAVVIATGAFQQPLIPALASRLDRSVVQTTSETYRNPGDIPKGVVLVVGDGASGRDIAAELSGTHEVLLARGRKRRLFPEYIFNRSTWWWLHTLGLMKARRNSLLGRLMRRADPFPNRGRGIADLRRMGVTIVPRLLDIAERTASFADGSERQIDAVVWSVGYRDDGSWLDIPEAKDSAGQFIQQDGRAPIPGLFHLGRPWQRNRASALVMGAGDDAAEIVASIVRSLQNA